MIMQNRKTLAAAVLILGAASVMLAMAKLSAEPDAGDRYSLQTLLQEPSLVGVAPRNTSWSPDGTMLAFTWNADGGDFQDIWILAAGDDAPRRITRHGGADSKGSGVGELVWLGTDPVRIAHVLGNALYVTDLQGDVEVIEDQVEHIRQLKLSPDGQQLSFVSGGPESGYLHEFHGDGSLWLRPADAGPEVPSRRILGDDIPRTFVQSYEWASDGQHIALLVGDNTDVPVRQLHYYDDGGEHQVYEFSRSFPGEETTRRRLGVLETSDGSMQWLELADEHYPIWGYGLSADGTRLFANTSNFVVKEHTIYVFDVATGKRETFYQFDDPQNVIPGWRAAWAPGDEGLILQTDRDGYYHLYHQPEANATPRPLTSGEWEIASFEVDTAHDQVYFVANKSHLSERQLYRVSMDGGDVEQLTREPGTWEPTFAPDFSRVALDFSSDESPQDLYVRDLVSGSGDVRRVTNSPRPEFANYEWARVSYPEFASHIDGMKVYGRLSVPPDFDPSRKYPMVVGSIYADTVRNQWARGGRPTWALDQHLVSQGYLVLKVNVRGSWGQGKQFSQGLIRDYGGIDTDDIESGVRHLINEGFVDPDRVGIWGNSYGGLMTSMSLFKKPGLYAAGIAGAPATNVAHAYPGQMWVMGEPHGDDFPERYQRQSALYQTGGLEDPYMIIHGTRDPVVLYSDTIALIEKLIEQNKMFELVTLPGAPHGWMAHTPEQTQFAFRKMIDFFDRHLKHEGQAVDAAGGR